MYSTIQRRFDSFLSWYVLSRGTPVIRESCYALLLVSYFILLVKWLLTILVLVSFTITPEDVVGSI